jgi:hypothetical protein
MFLIDDLDGACDHLHHFFECPSIPAVRHLPEELPAKLVVDVGMCLGTDMAAQEVFHQVAGAQQGPADIE